MFYYYIITKLRLSIDKSSSSLTVALALVLMVAEVAIKDATGVETDLLGAGVGCVGHGTRHVLILLLGGRSKRARMARA